MKLHDGGAEGMGEPRPGPARRRSPGQRGMTPLPVEWMDPMSWRLPSGKALAEFALQSGFLAPLWLGGGVGAIRARKPEAGAESGRSPGEVPVSAGGFRHGGTGERIAGHRG